MKLFWRFIRQCRLPRVFFLLLVGFQLSKSLLAIGIIQTVNRMIDVVQQGELMQVYPLIFWAGGLTVLDLFFTFWANHYISAKQLACEQAFQERFLEKTINLGKQSSGSVSSGELVTKAGQIAPDAVANSFSAISGLAEGTLVILFTVIYMFYLNIWIALGILVYNVLLQLLLPYATRKIKQENKKLSHFRSKSNADIVELLYQFFLIKVLNKFSFFEKIIIKKEQSIRQSALKAFAWENGTSEIVWITKKIIPEIIIVFGLGAFLISKGLIGYGVIVAAVMVSDIFAKGIITFSDGLICYSKACPNIELVNEYLEKTEEPLTRIHTGQDNCLTLSSVSFSFGERTLFEDVSLSIEKGDKVLITGSNGQGKSTLLNLVAGFYSPDSGKITFGNGFQSCAYIPQNPQLLTCDLRGNLLLGEIPKVDCKELLNIVSLSKQPEDNPSDFSTGEQQRVIIARGIYKGEPADLLLCDEIFSNLDKENTTLILKQLKNLWKDKTVLMVCHEKTDFPFNKHIIVDNKRIQVKQLLAEEALYE